MTGCTGFLHGHLSKSMRHNILLLLFLLPFVGNVSAQTKDREKAAGRCDFTGGFAEVLRHVPQVRG